MSISKSEAIVFLANNVGSSDGEFTEQEITVAMQNPAYAKAFEEYIALDGLSKVKSGELNEFYAIETLKKLSKDDQIEALAICFGIVMADGIMSDDEKDYLLKIAMRIGDIDWETVNSKYLEMKS
ncbi:MAG: TerB family tellurite resistance protein [Bacteroidales bacterium]|jgi:tellurite resistance protein|nr:TerB family tellurite resistance protein [Bacteroidales bacterium]MDD4214111.1 TerB family tellurite resistance protein [Bacteroidales bacterium]